MAEVELRHLATLSAVVELGSFGAAATALGYTQSTVSQQIAALERASGGRLFDRPGGPRRVRLTPLGQVVHEHAIRLLQGVAALHDAVDRFEAGEGRLTIGTLQSVSSTLLPILIRRLRDESPSCEIRLVEDESALPDLSRADLVFTDHRIDDPDVEQRKLLDDPYRVVCPRGRLPEGPVSLSDLSGVPMVSWPADCAQPALDEALTGTGMQLEIAFRANSNDAVLSMVRAGVGSAILPWLALYGGGATAEQTLSVHRLEPPMPPREIHLVRQARRTPSPLAARAATLAAEIAQDLERRQ
jgi:DNA-binding transcriptional LysR family regulator